MLAETRNPITGRSKTRGALWSFLAPLGMVLAAFSLLGCQAQSSPTATPPPSPKATPTPDQSAQREAWQAGPHADTYDLESGPNTYCSRCHSPANWDPAATIGEAPNCVSCKFAFEAEPRQAAGNPLVDPDQWASIGCDVCHRQEDGFFDAAIAWHDQVTEYYETVASATELCARCHLDSPTLKHWRELGDQAHVGAGCTDCHDPHSAEAACPDCHAVRMTRRPRLIVEHVEVTANSECEECHAGAWTAHDMELQQVSDEDCLKCHGGLMGAEGIAPIQYGHSPLHETVLCVACHDAARLEVGPLEGQNLWMTFRMTEFLGRATTAPYQSHNLQRQVDCTRCHYRDNPWSLAIEPAEGWNSVYGIDQVDGEGEGDE